MATIATALSAPAVLRAQPAKKYRVGYLSGAFGRMEWEDAFVAAMRELGYVEGGNLVIEYRWGGGMGPQQLARLAAELVELGPDLIVASPTPGALAAKQATKTIPIVFPISMDALEAGVVESLARPGGNITGLTLMSSDLIGKRIELFKEILPNARRIVFLVPKGFTQNYPHVVGPLIREMESKSRALHMALGVHEAPSFDEAGLDAAMGKIAETGADAVYILEGPSIAAEPAPIMGIALKHRLPVIGGLKEYAEGGALFFYGPDGGSLHRRAAVLADKILKGAKPADLPVEQPTTLEFVINLKAAKALGVTIPASLHLRADSIIE